MKSCDRKLIEERLAVLKGSKIEKIGRCANLIWVIFLAKNGAEYSLHLQTWFRIFRGEEVLITDGDKYNPTAEMEAAADFDYLEFDWDVQGGNRFDAWVNECARQILYDANVTKIEVNALGDVRLHLSNGAVLEVFLGATNDDECWRFFERGAEHFVVLGGCVHE